MLAIHERNAREAARYALAEIKAHDSALAHGLALTATQCARRAHEHADAMREHNRKAEAAREALALASVRRALTAPRGFLARLRAAL